jgi:hypothetical protein
MRQVLKLHPDSRCAAVAGVAAEVTRPGPGLLALRYLVTGATSELVLPAPAAPTRADELWRHTCFEAFVRAPTVGAYYEFNFAPSTQWAAYRFDRYRDGMAAADRLGPPHIEAGSTVEGFELTVLLDLDDAPGLPQDAPWRLGLSAVIEEACGRTSYWALAHPPGKPDFHHADCFALQLPAPERA